MPMPRKSDEAHALHGTASQVRHDAPPIEASRPRINRKNLSKAACAQFRKLARMLGARRTVTEGDSEILRLYAVLWDRHARATDALAAEGEMIDVTRLDSSGKPHISRIENPWLSIAVNCESKMVAILNQLGLTPVARKSAQPTKEEGPEGIRFK
jgi:P27 family predicted phage terminase small subunit